MPEHAGEDELAGGRSQHCRGEPTDRVLGALRRARITFGTRPASDLDCPAGGGIVC